MLPITEPWGGKTLIGQWGDVEELQLVVGCKHLAPFASRTFAGFFNSSAAAFKAGGFFTAFHIATRLPWTIGPFAYAE